MNESPESPPEPTGTRLRLPCGHRWSMPWGLPPEAAMADLLRHETLCELNAARPVLDPRSRGIGASPFLEEALP
jgi:hypothetical protein